MITGELKNKIDGLWDIFAAGEVIVYDKMGKVMERGMLKNGMKNGVFVRYDKEGRV